jgi:hypothetical protein
MPIEVKAYRCEFCGRVYLTKQVDVHEAKCFKNPARRACKTCAFEGFLPACRHEPNLRKEWYQAIQRRDFGDLSEPEPDNYIMPANCPGWKPKEEVSDANRSHGVEVPPLQAHLSHQEGGG